MEKINSSIASCCLGNILEWYDFGLFAIFSSLFSQLFFNTKDSHLALIATLGIFTIGFISRPIGALIFGYLGDKKGRAKTIRLSILMISLPTLLIGILPTYQHIGIAAPIFLLLIRIWQGISIGGEYGGNLIYLGETAPKKYRATVVSLASMGSNIGLLLATLVGMVTINFLSDDFLRSWGWRIPYFLSGFFSIIIYIFRLKIKETDIFENLKAKHQLSDNPIKTVVTKNIPQLLRTLGLVCMGSTFYYFCFIYLPLYLNKNLYFSMRDVATLQSVLITLMIILVPCAGLLCDKIGRRKMLLFNASLITVAIIPGFYLLQWSSMTFYVLAIFTIFSSLEQGTTPVALVENFPHPARYTGISLGYNLGNGFLGGTVPLVVEWLAYRTHFLLAPAFYISFCAAITLLVAFFFVPKRIPSSC